FVRQRGGQFSHHVDAVDMRKISLQLMQLFALLLRALSFRYVHRDTDVLTRFCRWIVMSYAAKESDGSVGAANPKFDVVILSYADCTLKFRPHGRLVFRVDRVIKAFKWNHPLVGIEAIQTGVFVR